MKQLQFAASHDGGSRAAAPQRMVIDKITCTAYLSVHRGYSCVIKLGLKPTSTFPASTNSEDLHHKAQDLQSIQPSEQHKKQLKATVQLEGVLLL